MWPHIIGPHNKKRLGCARLSYLCYFHVTPLCHCGERHAELLLFALCTLSPGSAKQFSPNTCEGSVVMWPLLPTQWEQMMLLFFMPVGQEFSLQLFFGYYFTETLCHTEHVPRHMAQLLSLTETWFFAHKSGRKTQRYRAVVLHRNCRSKFLCGSEFKQNHYKK